MGYYIATCEEKVYLNYNYMFIGSFIVYLFGYTCPYNVHHTVSGYLKYPFIHIYALFIPNITPLSYSITKTKIVEARR